MDYVEEYMKSYYFLVCFSGIINIATLALVDWIIPKHYILPPSLQPACDQVLDFLHDMEVQLLVYTLN